MSQIRYEKKKGILIVLLLAILGASIILVPGKKLHAASKDNVYYQFYTSKLKSFQYKKGVIKVKGTKDLEIRKCILGAGAEGMDIMHSLNIKVTRPIVWMDQTEEVGFKQSTYKKIKKKIDAVRGSSTHIYLVTVSTPTSKGKRPSVEIRTMI